MISLSAIRTFVVRTMEWLRPQAAEAALQRDHTMRVMVIEAAGNLWGSERALLDQLEAMPTVGVAVCCPQGAPLIAELEKRGIHVLPRYVAGLHQKSRWHRAYAALKVLRACLEFRPHLIYLNQSGAYRVVLLAATLLSVAIIAHVRIFEDAPYLARQKPSVRRLRGLIAISEAVENEIRRFSELDAVPVHRLYDAYTLARPTVTSPRIADRVACVGRLVPIKGQDVLVAAVGILKSTGKDVDCLIAGEGDERYIRELEILAADYKAHSSIRWLGFVGDVVKLLRTCSILVCPSHREPLGRVIFEAWDAHVVPVVFAGSGGAAEIVAAAQGGILYDEQTPEMLAKALREALELDREQAARLVNNGRLWMAEQCDTKTYGEKISRILRSATFTC
jgi:glycosyltransferase involved in cell wall biosynthesis